MKSLTKDCYLAIFEIERQEPVKDLLGGDVVPLVQVVDREEVDDRSQLKLDRDRQNVLLEQEKRYRDDVKTVKIYIQRAPLGPKNSGRC